MNKTFVSLLIVLLFATSTYADIWRFIPPGPATLQLSAADEYGVAEMQFSFDKETWTDPVPYAETHQLELPEGDGIKEVFVRYKDNAGNWSDIFATTAIRDTTSPTGTIEVRGGFTADITVNVTIN